MRTKINNIKELLAYIQKSEKEDLNEDIALEEAKKLEEDIIEFKDKKLMELFDHWLFTGEVPNEN